MQIWIKLPKIMRIRIRNPAFYSGSLGSCFNMFCQYRAAHLKREKLVITFTSLRQGVKRGEEGACQTCKDTVDDGEEEKKEQQQQEGEGRGYQGLGFIPSPTAR
jgi:hypothetical protein